MQETDDPPRLSARGLPLKVDVSRGSAGANAPAASAPFSWWVPVLLAAMAGGMGWGIRGQYGHETGAMIAGLLVGLVLVLCVCPRAEVGWAARAVAWGTVAIGIGGSMTYGQTVGLTHDPALTGNWAALRWGMLGLAMKGGVWIGFAGLFLGMGLGGVRYRASELLLLMLALIGLFVVGVWLFNQPFVPESHRLPLIYFSDHWRWEPNAELSPRPEVWGGQGLALMGAILYVALRRRDPLAWRLALWGLLGGALGFPAGQSVQALHAWNPEILSHGWLARLAPHINWWNWMETIFGATFGGVLGLGTWVHRRRIRPSEGGSGSRFPLGLEIGLAAIHVTLVVAGSVFDSTWAEAYQEVGLVLAAMPIVAVAGGRLWPWLVIFPVTLIPIALKTAQRLVTEDSVMPALLGWSALFVAPLVAATLATVWAYQRSAKGSATVAVLPQALLLVTWTYFGLNFAVFDFPWPWTNWTVRTPNSLAFALCAIGLSVLALRVWQRSARSTDSVSG